MNGGTGPHVGVPRLSVSPPGRGNVRFIHPHAIYAY
ncbi:hypothetical protein BCEN4_150088 [Burkholderia cenocepacia]|nr:hypothetical protein BCEN4_150088 [Burkholderia cenocepacia]